MSKRSDKQRRRERRKPRRAPQEPAVLRLVEYQVTNEPIHVPSDRTPRELEEQMEELHGLVQEHPDQAIPKLEALLERYPGAPKPGRWTSSVSWAPLKN